MKNKNGFTLIELLAILVIIGFIMVMIFPSLEKLTDNTNKQTYDAYEKMMVEYADVTDFNGKTYICLKELNSENYGGLNDIIGKEFNGYVKKINGEYKAFITGSNYTTEGYDTTIICN